MQVSTAEPKLIILEGVDRSGKDSMQDAIDRSTKYKHMVMDRGPIGFQAYCEIYGKSEELMKSYRQMEERMSLLEEEILVIYLTADTSELIDRCKRTDHEILDFELHKQIYEKFVKSSRFNSITVDTTNKHVNEIVEDLVREGVL